MASFSRSEHNFELQRRLSTYIGTNRVYFYALQKDAIDTVRPKKSCILYEHEDEVTQLVKAHLGF